jgi:MOSC domain-containing protein YiiM
MSRSDRSAARRSEALALPFPRSEGGGDIGGVGSLSRSNGGVPKLAVASARITAHGMEGDRQRNLKHHGGPDRALCLYSMDLLEALQAEGPPVAPGTMGENVLVRGIRWEGLGEGAKFRMGEIEIELTTFALPCRNISGSFVITSRKPAGM